MKDNDSGQWYHDSKGNISGGRIFSAWGVVFSGIILVTSTVVFLVSSLYPNVPNEGVIEFALIGAGLFTTAIGGKVVQKMSEVKEVEITSENNIPEEHPINE